MQWLDKILNKVTMYALMTYYLMYLIGVSIGLMFFGVLPYDPWKAIAATLVLYGAAKISNPILGKLFKVKPNSESSAITGLILALIVGPDIAWSTLPWLVLISVIAMASKYIIVFQRRHIFNPAALAVLISYFAFGIGASWWIGTLPMVIFVILGGLVFIRKVKWFHLVFSFLITYLVAQSIVLRLLSPDADIIGLVKNLLLYSPILFFSFVMLTEPLTAPSGKNARIGYGIFVALVAVLVPHFFSISYGLEGALLIANLVGLLVFGNTRRFLKLKEKVTVAKDTLLFKFQPNQKLAFEAGQFLLWSLPHPKSDLRGHRRYFTIASSPTENELMLVTKMAEKSSTFKTHMKDMTGEQEMMVSSRDGDFVLPKNSEQHCVFIAGGVGVAPFRSMVKYLLDTKQKQPITMLYSNNLAEEIAFKNVFDEAEKTFGMKTVYTLTDKEHLPADWHGKTGYVSGELIKAEVKDYQKAIYYLSGPDSMVKAIEKTLHDIGISRSQIKTDYFPGYA